MAPAFRLVMQSGSEVGTEYPLEKTEMFLGRDLSNDIVINDPEVSRRHVRLILAGNSYVIEDLGSTNGTYIGDQRLGAPVMIQPGDLITLGEKVILRFDAKVINTDATVAAVRTPSFSDQRTVSPAFRPSEPVEPAQVPLPPEVPESPASETFEPVEPSLQVAVPEMPPSQQGELTYMPEKPPAPVFTPPPAAVPSYVPPSTPAPAYIPPKPVVPVYTPPRPATPAHPPQQPIASAYTPISPVGDDFEPPVKKRSGWLVALLVVIGILVVFCIIPWVIIELTNSYCALFPGIFNAIQPGACP